MAKIPVHTPDAAVIAGASYMDGALRVEVVDGGPGVSVTATGCFDCWSVVAVADKVRSWC